MTDRPVIFSAPMILALLREVKKPGTGKTQTRRLLYAERKAKNGIVPASAGMLQGYEMPFSPTPESYYALSGWHKAQPGDRLWVRENRWINGGYSATDQPNIKNEGKRPAIHCARVDSRLTLEVRETKIERVHAITPSDCHAEGIEQIGPAEFACTADGKGWWHICPTYQKAFEWLWRKLHGDESWEDNPWVVALTFRVCAVNIDAHIAPAPLVKRTVSG